jgi:preprotein translocase subunit SecA
MNKTTVEEKCQFCGEKAFKTNGKSELICENRANTGRCEGAKPVTKEELGGVKVGRNEQCPCGSGKKFKKCHGEFSNYYGYKN